MTPEEWDNVEKVLKERDEKKKKLLKEKIKAFSPEYLNLFNKTIDEVFDDEE